MKFTYDGEYREFRGYVFKWGKPTTVNDPATIAAIMKDPTFKEIKDEEAKETPEESPVPDACSKCGRVVKRGKFLHQKHCKGPK